MMQKNSRLPDPVSTAISAVKAVKTEPPEAINCAEDRATFRRLWGRIPSHLQGMNIGLEETY